MSFERFEGSALLPVQTAMYQALINDSVLMNMVSGVYDEPDKCGALPYVLIDGVTSVPFRTHTRKGEEVTVTFHIWSDYQGNAEMGAILSHMNRVLGDAPLAVAGYDVVRCFLEFSEFIKRVEEGQVSRFAPVRYRVLAQEAA